MKLVESQTLRARWVSCLSVFLVIVLGYGAALGFDFINYDDPEYITENVHVNRGLSVENTKWALTSVGRVNLWHPLTYFSHQLDVSLFGLNPKGHHAMNVLLHSLAGVFLYLLITQLTKSRWLPLIIVAIWAFHPQRVQSVAWLSERKDVLSGVFFFITLYCFTRWLKGRKEGYYWLSLASFVLALLSKPSVVSLPFILVGIYCLFYKEKLSWKGLFARLIPFFTFSVLTAMVTMYFQSQGGLSGLSDGMGSTDYFAKILLSFSFYIERFLSPTTHQLWFYPDLSTKSIIISAAVSLVSVVLVLLVARKSKLVSFGALWYLVMWLPVSGIVPLSYYFRADRYSYLPQIGLIFVLAGMLIIVSQKWPAVSKLAIAGAGLAMGCLVLLQQTHLRLWQNNQTLFKHEMTVNPRSLLAPIHYAQSVERDQPLIALGYYTKAHLIDKESGLALTNMGVIYEKQGMLTEAVSCYRKATQTAVQDQECWVRLIDLLTREGESENVEKYITTSLELYPNSKDLMLAAARYFYGVKRDAESALVYYRKLYAMNMRCSAFIKDYAIVAYTAGHKKEAKELFLLLPLVERNHPAIKAILDE